ncbi:hypothetical protein D3C73_1468830 [compost metagenome]
MSGDKTEAFVAYFRMLAKPNAPISRLSLKGLNPELDYMIETGAASDDGAADHSGAEASASAGTSGSAFQEGFGGTLHGGDRLMRIGLVVSDLHGDFASCTYRLRAARR